LLKIIFGTALLRSANRFVRQQHRSEIMQCFAFVVNFFFSSVQRRIFQHCNNNTLISLGFQPCREAEA